MEYYNEFKLTMETNAKAKEASEILINRLNKGFEIDKTYRFNPSSKMAQVISANEILSHSMVTMVTTLLKIPRKSSSSF